jgi:23S rRNA pseudouridine1911/1915/1917 synthase
LEGSVAEPGAAPTPLVLVACVLGQGAAVDRLDRVAAARFPAFIASRSHALRMCDEGRITVNGKAAESCHRVRAGDHIAFHEDTSPDLPIYPLDLKVCYEDEAMAVVHKPAGLPVSANRFRTVANALGHNLTPSASPDALRRPWPPHRLDAQTSGLLVVGKTARAIAQLGRAFAEREVHKTYTALLRGHLEGEGTVDTPIEGRAALTHFRVLDWTPSTRGGAVTAVQLTPVTGRKHQLRRHMASLGHPVIGDRLYTEGGALLRGGGLYLASTAVDLPHPLGPEGRRVQVEIPAPAKFAALWGRIERMWRRDQELRAAGLI